MAKAKKTEKKPSERDMLIDLCVDIYAHSEMDMEVTLGGNGTNCCEAANVAREILTILGESRKKLAGKISARVKELEEEYGCDCDCECDE
jgi:hypothetical protein